MLILVVVFVIPVLVASLTVALIRNFYRKSGKEQVYKNGVVLTDDGIEYLGLSFTGTCKKAYSEIDSVDLISNSKYLFSFFLVWVKHMAHRAVLLRAGSCYQIETSESV